MKDEKRKGIAAGWSWNRRGRGLNAQGDVLSQMRPQAPAHCNRSTGEQQKHRGAADIIQSVALLSHFSLRQGLSLILNFM